MSDISWTRTALIEVVGIPPLKMKEWERWQLENNNHPLLKLIRKGAAGALDYKGVFKVKEGDRALAILQQMLEEVTPTRNIVWKESADIWRVPTSEECLP